MSVTYELITSEEGGSFPVSKMCAWSRVSRSGFYDWKRRTPSATVERRERLTGQVVKIFNDFKQRYGYRKITVELARQGHDVSQYLVRRIMNDNDLVCCHPLKWRTTTDGDPTAKTVDRLQGNFTANEPGKRFVGDITYISTWAGWLYLATVIDLFNREVVGYALASHMRTSLVTDAIDMAVANGRVNAGAVFHSDRGSQYTSTHFASHLAKHNMVGSMGRTGVCWDNAVAESFFATLKKELTNRTVYPTRRQAVKAVVDYIELFYNRRRIHSKLGYNTPIETREAWQNRNQAA